MELNCQFSPDGLNWYQMEIHMIALVTWHNSKPNKVDHCTENMESAWEFTIILLCKTVLIVIKSNMSIKYTILKMPTTQVLKNKQKRFWIAY